MIFSTHNLNCLNFLFLMKVGLFLNLLLISFLQKTIKPNLPQSFPKSFPTFSYNILLHSLTKLPLSLHILSHNIPSIYQLPIQSYTHTYTPFVHTLDLKIHTPILSYTTHTYTHHIYTTHSSHTPTPFHSKYTHYSQPIHILTYTLLHTTSQPSNLLQHISTIHPSSPLFHHMC